MTKKELAVQAHWVLFRLYHHHDLKDLSALGQDSALEHSNRQV